MDKNLIETPLLSKMQAATLKSIFLSGKRLEGPRCFEKENLGDVDLKGKDLPACDFVGAIFGEGQDLSRANLTRCKFGPPRQGLFRVHLNKVNLMSARLAHAQLIGVSLQDCNLIQADLTQADLSHSNCMQSDFSYASLYEVNLLHANLFQARFNKTRFSLKKRPILQADPKAWSTWCEEHHYLDLKDKEIDRLEQGIAIYLELKENFKSIGDYAEASWAYVQERRLRRACHSPRVASHYFKSDYPRGWVGKLGFYLWHGWLWTSDFLVDLCTGYGESLARALLTLTILVAAIFPMLYALAGGVKLTATDTGQVQVSRQYINLLLFSVGSLTQGYAGLSGATELSQHIQAAEQFVGVLMIGLIGFILGNRINQH